KQAKGLVKREVTRIVTPGTLTDDALLDPQASNFLAAVALASNAAKSAAPVGLAWVDLSTGRFFAAAFPLDQFADQLGRIQPAELLVSDEAAALPAVWIDVKKITKRQAWTFGQTAAVDMLAKHFGTRTVQGFGFDVETSAGDLIALR